MKKIYLILITMATIFQAFAHPHLFAGVDLTFDFNQTGYVVVSQKWVFDDMTSKIIVEDYDLNDDYKFSSSEIKDIESYVVDGLKDYNFYTDIALNDENYLIPEVKNFFVGIEDICVYYEFDIYVPVDKLKQEQNVKVSVYDKEFYTKFFLNTSKGIFFTESDKVNYEFSYYENKDKTFYYGQFSPLEISVNFSSK